MAKHDPTRTLTAVNKAEASCRARLKAAQTQVLALIKPALAVNAEYSFVLDEQRLLALGADIRAIVDEQMLVTEGGGIWLFEGYVKPAYIAGAGRAFSNIAAQSSTYATLRPNIMSVLMSAPFQNRMGLLRARVFEEMAGFSGELGDKLAATLTRGVGNGLGAIEIANQLVQNFDVTQYRAERIARTEITTALRRGRMDESDAASESIGLEIKLMHISAFSPTSRPTHTSRHSLLFTSEQQRLWWSIDGNSINCMCSVIEVIIGTNGEPLAPGLLTRAQTIKDKNT